ncbi:MAG TPA: tRNA epoxyqueuosine(34) reductase QueG [Casimicrobiaceae bacterium]
MTRDARERDWEALAARIAAWGHELGFESIGVSDVDLAAEEVQLMNWLRAGRHGEMDYMARHGATRARPAALVPGTVRAITARLNYWPARAQPAQAVLADSRRAYVARYALGRDYHKVLRNRLAQLATRIENDVGPFGYRVFTDSAPVLEVALAAKSGLGWRGKHTLLLTRDMGSYFFLGEIYTDLPLPVTEPVTAHCGTCTACLSACPTGAIVAPYELDARRCISYLTIELKGSIPEPLRPLIGNRVYGCDDCQLACPWNRYAVTTSVEDFEAVRNGLDGAALTTLFAWTEEEFLRNTEGSAIRRIGYERWSRNVAVALGNADPDLSILQALESRANDPSPLVREHVAWAIGRQRALAYSLPPPHARPRGSEKSAIKPRAPGHEARSPHARAPCPSSQAADPAASRVRDKSRRKS